MRKSAIYYYVNWLLLNNDGCKGRCQKLTLSLRDGCIMHSFTVMSLWRLISCFIVQYIIIFKIYTISEKCHFSILLYNTLYIWNNHNKNSFLLMHEELKYELMSFAHGNLWLIEKMYNWFWISPPQNLFYEFQHHIISTEKSLEEEFWNWKYVNMK